MASEIEARRRQERIRLLASSVRDGIDKIGALVHEAKESNDHEALGYKSWTAYLSDTLGAEPMRLDRSGRREVVALLTGEGMSTRAIAPIVGASIGTVHGDQVFNSEHLEPVPTGGPGNTPSFEPVVIDGDADDEWLRDQLDEDDAILAAHDEDEVAAEVAGLPAFGPETGGLLGDEPRPQKTTGLDGKTYTRPESTKPRRSPLPDSFFRAAYDVTKKVESLVRLTEDDRFPANREQVALRHKNDLLRTAEALDGVLRALTTNH